MENKRSKVQSGKQQETILLSVVIATYNGADYIKRCLNSFTRQSISKDKFEVIVVNNNSSDHTNQIVSPFVNQHPNIILLEEKQQGVSYARNLGISSSKGKYICFIDDDAYADSDWLKNILYAFENITPQPAVIGGEILPYYTSDKPVWFADEYEVRTKGDKPRFLSLDECNSGFPESNFNVRKQILDETGYFSTDFGPKGEQMIFGEGSELSRRISSNHPNFWYDPCIFVYHIVLQRNMSIKYILSRKYDTAYIYQALRTPSLGIIKNGFTLITCLARILFNALLSIIFVRWFTKKTINDWLFHIIPLVNCSARSIFIFKHYLSKNPFRNQ